jgi:hypothetical protein
MMFNPFRDRQGSPKPLSAITYSDLAQLADYDEGFVLEFKQSFSPTVRRKIPKIVASFSNSRGGWLIIGVADEDKSLTPIPREKFDYSQAVGELCRSHISPTPRFDMRFLSNPAKADEGVLIIQISEGDFPPYVADGIVEVREGSTSGPATSASLVQLYDKAIARERRILEFCHRTVYFVGGLALFNLYLYRGGPNHPDAIRRDEIAAHASVLQSAFTQMGMDCHIQHAHDSLIFRTSKPRGPEDAHSTIELFGDESMKLTVPAVLLEKQQKEQALEAAGLKDGQFMSASATLRRVTRMAALLDRYVGQRSLSWQDFDVAYELEGMAGVILWSDEPLYQEYIRTKGILFCGTTDCRSTLRHLNDGEHESFRARQFAGSHFFEACGLPLGSTDAQDAALVAALLHD